MKLFLPSLKKLRIVYAYLLLKGTKQNGIISYSDVKEALAMANITPSKYLTKKYLMMLDSHEPKLLKFYKPGLLDMYYRILAYVVHSDGSVELIDVNNLSEFRNVLLRVIHDLDTCFATAREIIVGDENVQNVHDN